MKTIILLFAASILGAAPAQAKTPCQLPLYIQAEHGVSASAADNTVNLFLYGLKSAVTVRDGCIVDKISDAHLGLYIRSVNLMNESGRSDSAILSVALAVPLNGVPVYMDDYVFVIRDADSIDGQVTTLLENIGETLESRSTNPGQ